MKTLTALTMTTALVALWSTFASALDVPEGGDAFFHQLRASATTVVAKLNQVGDKGLEFSTDQVLSGPEVGAKFVVRQDDFLRRAPLQVGDHYLMFLRGKRPGLPVLIGGYSLATSISSLFEVQETDVRELKIVIDDYAKFKEDRVALKRALLVHAKSKVAVIQRSAVSDLIGFTRFELSDARILGGLLAEGVIIDSRARQDIVLQLERFKISDFNRILIGLIKSKRETVAVKVAAIDALATMKDDKALSEVSLDVQAHQSLRLKERYYGRVKQ